MSNSTYIAHIINQINIAAKNCGSVLMFGENIDNGSRIAGLARGLTVNSESKILNVGNCELTHCGIGFGMMMDGGQSVLFSKQLDFILLGLDQICNTYNSIRAFLSPDKYGSFTIYVIVCDQGYQGPQSSFNGAGDFASIANIPVFCLNAMDDSDLVIKNQFVKNGFRIITVSQKSFGMPALNSPAIWHSEDVSLFQYGSGNSATLLCYNFSLREVLNLDSTMRSKNIHCDLFHANYVNNKLDQRLIESINRSKKLLIFDDSKSVTKFGDSLVTRLLEAGVSLDTLRFYTRRGVKDSEYGVNADTYELDIEDITRYIQSVRIDQS